jgi:hypothetical protein
MRLRSSAAAVIVFVAVVSAVGQDQADKAPSTEELLERAVVVPAGPQSASLAFESLMLAAGVPGGQVLEQGCWTDTEPQVRLKASGTLKELLASFASAGPPFHWEVRDGVVDLLPATGVPPLLLTRIGTYDSDKAADIVTANAFLLGSPKVRDAASRLRLTQGISSGLTAASPRPAPPPKPLGLRLQNATLIDALNALVRINGHGVWVYREVHCPTKTYFDVKIAQ